MNAIFKIDLHLPYFFTMIKQEDFENDIHKCNINVFQLLISQFFFYEKKALSMLKAETFQKSYCINFGINSLYIHIQLE